MHRLLKFILVSLLVLPATLRAQFNWSTNANNTLTLNSYIGPGGNVTVPDTVGGHSVTGIGDIAFYQCPSLISVTIPASITSIGAFAFQSCSSLTSITVAPANPAYSSSAGVLFDKDCTTLIQYPPGLAGDYSIPDSVKIIGDIAFYQCSSLTSLTLPSGVTNILDPGFSGCASLNKIVVSPANPAYASVAGVLFNKSLTTLRLYPRGLAGSYQIPDGVTAVETAAFSGCTLLTDLTIPASVGDIGGYIGAGMISLSNITVAAANPAFASVEGVLFSKDLTLLRLYPAARTGSYAIPNGVAVITDSAFCNCTNLISVTIPASTHTIEQFAFGWCSGLTNLATGPSVTTIGSNAFLYCTGLASVTVGASVTNIGSAAFRDCTSLASATLGSNLATIGASAFKNCHLRSVVIPDSTIVIGDEAFHMGGMLTNVVLGKNVVTIGNTAFAGCYLDSLIIPDQVTTIGYSAFASCGAMSVTLPDSLTSLGNNAFASCSRLARLNLPRNLTTIGYGTFDGCSKLSEVIIPDQVTTISTFAFHNCNSLTNLVLGRNVTTIADYAFLGCRGLTTVTIPDHVTTMGISAFGQCINLRAAYFQGNAPGGDDSIFHWESGTVWYLPGTLGWSGTFGSWPTALWQRPNPVILNQTSGLESPDGSFGFTTSWVNTNAVVVEASTDLLNWSPVATNSLVNYTNRFQDPNWANYAHRYYRVRTL